MVSFTGALLSHWFCNIVIGKPPECRCLLLKPENCKEKQPVLSKLAKQFPDRIKARTNPPTPAFVVICFR